MTLSLPSRVAIASFHEWSASSQVALELSHLGFGSDKIFCLSLQSLIPSKPAGFALPDFVELTGLEGAAQVSCSPASIAATLTAGSNGGGRTLEELLSNWLLPRQAQRIASYIKQGKIVVGLFLAKGEDERAASLALLARSATPVEVHDLVGATPVSDAASCSSVGNGRDADNTES